MDASAPHAICRVSKGARRPEARARNDLIAGEPRRTRACSRGPASRLGKLTTSLGAMQGRVSNPPYGFLRERESGELSCAAVEFSISLKFVMLTSPSGNRAVISSVPPSAAI